MIPSLQSHPLSIGRILTVGLDRKKAPLLTPGLVNVASMDSLLKSHKNAGRFAARSTALPMAQFPALQGLLYVNPCSLQNIAETESTNRPNDFSGSQACRSAQSTQPCQRRVGIDTINLMVVDLETHQQLHRRSPQRFQRLQKKLAAEGIHLSKFHFSRKTASPWIDHGSFKFSLCISEVANRLCHGRHHNSYVASREEACRVFDLLCQVCASEGIELDYRALQVIRLDLFRDAVLRELGLPYFQLLKLISRSARLTGGDCYPNGIDGHGERTAWSFYGKGHWLLERAKEGVEGGLSLEELLAEHSADEWMPVFPLEVRWHRSASIPDLRPQGESLSRGQGMSNDRSADLVAKLTAEPEKEMPRMCVGELLDQWDQLPTLYAKTARYRCLPLSRSMDKVAKGVQGAQAQQNRCGQRLSQTACPRRRWRARLEAAARKKNVVLDRSFLEALPAYDDPKFAATKGWLLASPLRCLRQYLASLNFSPHFICYHCKTYRQAEIEYASCQGVDILGQIAEIEKAFLLDGDEDAPVLPAPASPLVPPPVPPLRSRVLLLNVTPRRPISIRRARYSQGREGARLKRLSPKWPSLKLPLRTAFTLKGRGRFERSNRLSGEECRWRLGRRRWSRYAGRCYAGADDYTSLYRHRYHCLTLGLLDKFSDDFPPQTHPPWVPSA
jgi:hypothetical protein